jgi:hypothetical protein
MLITHNSINLERPSLKCRSIVEERKKEQMNMTKHESSILKKIKSELNLDQNENEIKKKKKKKSGQNPLSMKKKTKKKSLENSLTKTSIKKKRRRTRQIRMSLHLKEHLKQLKKTFSIKDYFHLK